MINPEKMQYQENKSGSSMVTIFILLNMFYTIMMLKSMPMTMAIGSFTMINILISLVAFLASTNFKIYKLKWAYGGVVGAIIQALRFGAIPDSFSSGLKILLLVSLEVSAILLLVGSIITIIKTKAKEKYELEEQSQVN
jgi:hypothetical protein